MASKARNNKIEEKISGSTKNRKTNCNVKSVDNGMNGKDIEPTKEQYTQTPKFRSTYFKIKTK